MSTSSVVDQKYRLGPADLHSSAHRAVIVNISYQGLEELKPVAHFDGPVKPMVLSPTHVRDLMQITGTAIFSDWIGQTLVLALPRSSGASKIELLPESDQSSRFPSVIPSDRFDLSRWLLALLIVLGLGIISLAYVQQNGQALWDTILALFG